MSEPTRHPFRDFFINQTLFSVFGLMGGTIYAFASGGDKLFLITLGVVVPSLMITAMMAIDPVHRGRAAETVPWLAGGIAWCAIVAAVFMAVEPSGRDEVWAYVAGAEGGISAADLFARWWEALTYALIIFGLCYAWLLFKWGLTRALGHRD